MAYDGFYSELSTRGSTNEVLNLAIQTKEEIELLAAQAAQSAIDASEAGAAAGAIAGAEAADVVVTGKVDASDLADAVNILLGSSLVGHEGSTVRAKLVQLASTKAETADVTAALALKVSTTTLADTASVSQGAALVGRVNQVVKTIVELKALLKTVASRHAFVTGYYSQGDGGGGHYWYDSTDTTSVDNGGTIIVATDGGRWKLVQTGRVSIKQFGMIAGVYDAPTLAANDICIQAARDWVASGPLRNQLVFTTGTYGYTVSPNWAIADAYIIGDGEVRLRYFGTGNAVIIDHGPTINTYLFNVTMENFIVECPSTAQHGVYIRSCHHSRFLFQVEGAGTAYGGITVDFAVCSDFSGCEVTPAGEGDWYLSSRPQYGLWLRKRNGGEQTSYCLFNNCIWEHLTASGGAGILLEGTLGNVFVGGTSEASNHGLITTAEAINNRFYGIDFEANSVRDVLEGGQGTEFHGVDSATLVTIGSGALFPKYIGGSYQTVEIATGARWPLFQGISISRFASGGFNIGEPSCIFRDCINLQTQKLSPMLQGAITVTGSPFTYLNNTGNDRLVSISGGTVSAIVYTRDGIDVTLSGVAGLFHLSPGDSLRVTYSVLPNMYFWMK